MPVLKYMIYYISGRWGKILKDLVSIRGFELIWNSLEGFINAEIEFDY